MMGNNNKMKKKCKTTLGSREEVLENVWEVRQKEKEGLYNCCTCCLGGKQQVYKKSKEVGLAT